MQASEVSMGVGGKYMWEEILKFFAECSLMWVWQHVKDCMFTEGWDTIMFL